MARTSFSGPVASTNGFIPTSRVSVTATGALSAAAVETGYITHTGAGAIVLTLPAPLTVAGPPSVQGIVPRLNAVAGQKLDFVVDCRNGGNVTIAVAAPATAILSDAASTAASAVAFGRVVITGGANGSVGKFTLIFTGGDAAPTVANPQPNQGIPGSATGYVLSRTA
jgi:hypothetical protein